VLIPACVDICKGARSPLTGEPVYVVAAGGIGDGRQLAACLMCVASGPLEIDLADLSIRSRNGAVGGWIGTRFVAAEEAGASRQHQDAIVKATHDVTTRTRASPPVARLLGR
jgi:NAD(P)H-dependent flavin oxidoreductase YrpB (nitropropane dioxygenase family)